MDSTNIIHKKVFYGQCPHCKTGKVYLEQGYDFDDKVCFSCGYRVNINHPQIHQRKEQELNWNV